MENLIEARLQSLEQFAKDVGELSRRLSLDSILDNVMSIFRNEIYAHYPFLFVEAFIDPASAKDVSITGKLSRAGNFYYLHLVLSHWISTKQFPGHDLEILLLSSELHRRALSVLGSLFPDDSPFWTLFEEYHDQYISAILSENRNHCERYVPYPENEFEIIASGKSSMAKFVTAGLAILNNKSALVQPLSISQDYFHIAFQLADDVRDWRRDYERKKYSYVLSKVIETHRLESEVNSSARPEADLIGKMMYFSGTAEYALRLSVEYYERALTAVAGVNCGEWKQAIETRRDRGISDINKIESTRKSQLDKVSTSRNKRIRAAESATSEAHVYHEVESCAGGEGAAFDVNQSIQRGVHFVLARQREEGNWVDIRINVGSSTEWVTGYVAGNLSTISKCHAEIPSLKSGLQGAGRWLLNQQHRNGGWGFNHESGVDADSTSTCLMFLKNEGMLTDSEMKRGIEVLLSSQNSDEGIGTYSAESIEFEIQLKNPLFVRLPIDRYKGWRSSDTYVSAMVVLALSQSGVAEELPILERIVRFICSKQLASGCWNAYWSNGKMIGTSYCIQALSKVADTHPAIERAVEWLLASQRKEGAWTDGATEITTPYDTALAIKALVSQSICRDTLTSGVTRGMQWLAAHQLEDGSWESFPFMTAPRPWDDGQLDSPQLLPAAKDESRIFTTATVVSTLAMCSQFSPVQRENVVS